MFRLHVCLLGKQFSGRVLDCWMKFLQAAPGLDLTVVMHRHYDPVVANARNALGKAVLGTGYDAVLFADEDEVFEANDVLRLLEAGCGADQEAARRGRCEGGA